MDLSYAWDGNALVTFSRIEDVSFSNYYPQNNTQLMRKLQEELSNNRPVLIRIDKPNTTHWVVAYGFTSDDNTYSSILVSDPYNSDSTSPIGRRRTLQEVFASNNGVGISRIVTTKA